MTTTRPFEDDPPIEAQPNDPDIPTAAAPCRNLLRSMLPPLFLQGRKIRGERIDLLLGEALGELLHDGGGSLAVAEFAQLRGDQLAIPAGQPRNRPALGPPVGAVAVGAGRCETSRIQRGGILRERCRNR